MYLYKLFLLIYLETQLCLMCIEKSVIPHLLSTHCGFLVFCWWAGVQVWRIIWLHPRSSFRQILFYICKSVRNDQNLGIKQLSTYYRTAMTKFLSQLLNPSVPSIIIHSALQWNSSTRCSSIRLWFFNAIMNHCLHQITLRRKWIRLYFRSGLFYHTTCKLWECPIGYQQLDSRSTRMLRK